MAGVVFLGLDSTGLITIIHPLLLCLLPCFLAASIFHKVTVGTQAAVLAGLDITMFIEFNPPNNAEWVGDHFPVARRVMS